MFTGIIEETGCINSISQQHTSSRLSIKAKKIMEDIQLGDSICVNGICLTVCTIEQNNFHADVMNETLKRTSLRQLKKGSFVNLERAMLANGRFGGHIVSGHIDGTGMLLSKKEDGIAVILTIQTSIDIINNIIEKGSVALDGISLTVCTINADAKFFQVSIIPHTISNTILPYRKIGDLLNIENDIIGKYIKKFTESPTQTHQKIELTLDFLTKNGF